MDEMGKVNARASIYAYVEGEFGLEQHGIT